LYVTLYEVGEHIAAGAPITPSTAEEVERLARFLRELAHAIGRKRNAYCDHVGVGNPSAASAADDRIGSCG
jgi:hypothetical protein